MQECEATGFKYSLFALPVYYTASPPQLKSHPYLSQFSLHSTCALLSLSLELFLLRASILIPPFLTLAVTSGYILQSQDSDLGPKDERACDICLSGSQLHHTFVNITVELYSLYWLVRALYLAVIYTNNIIVSYPWKQNKNWFYWFLIFSICLNLNHVFPIPYLIK